MTRAPRKEPTRRKEVCIGCGIPCECGFGGRVKPPDVRAPRKERAHWDKCLGMLDEKACTCGARKPTPPKPPIPATCAAPNCTRCDSECWIDDVDHATVHHMPECPCRPAPTETDAPAMCACGKPDDPRVVHAPLDKGEIHDLCYERADAPASGEPCKGHGLIGCPCRAPRVVPVPLSSLESWAEAVEGALASPTLRTIPAIRSLVTTLASIRQYATKGGR